MTRRIQAPTAHAPRPLPRRLRPLGRAFYARSVLAVAPDLLGHLLVHETPAGRLVGRIVETEAYRAADDPASHAYRLTPRSRIMAGPPGVAYVYFTYGNHFCLNVVADREGKASAVLLRAVEPVVGIDLMAARRGTTSPRLLASGPGRLTSAMRVDRRHNGWDLTRRPLFIADGRPGRRRIVTGPRVGIRRAADRPWRFALRDNEFVSQRATRRPRPSPVRRQEAQRGGED